MAGVINNDVWKHWEKSGKQEFLKICMQFVKNDSQNIIFDKDLKPSVLYHCLNILIDKGIKGAIKKESVVTTLHEVATAHNDAPALICDLLNAADAVTSQNSAEDPKERANFCFIIRECEKFLSDKLYKERLEIDTLQEVEILKNKTFYSKFIKIKTKLYYKQRKFNLFREECEGFAKLATELNKEFTSSTDYKDILGIVHSLIGCFNLDPNRVLDVILESFENKPKEARVFVPLISHYMKDPSIISEVLSTKFAFLKNNQLEIPQSLYVLMAQLIQHQLIKLEDVYYWLTPDDKSIDKDYEKCLKDAKEYVRKLQIISLNNKEKEENNEEPEATVDNYTDNQKLGLCEGLLLVGDWQNAQSLIKRLPPYYAVGYEPIASAICDLLHHIIEQLYNEHCTLGPKITRKPYPLHDNPLAPKRASSFVELRNTAFPMLISLGSSLRFDPVLLSKILRLSKAALAKCDDKNGPDSLYYDIISIIDLTILPSLSYMDCNCCIAEEIWTLLKFYPYQVRYCLYSRWKNETYSMYPELMKKRGDAEKQIKNIMKRVSKENVKPVGRLIGKLTHCSPGFLFDYVLLQIQVYSNLINPVVDSLKYLTNLSYDVLGFCLIETLGNADKKRVKHDSTSISTWLQSLSSFCGAVYKKYSIELTGLLQYVANQLKAQKSLDLLILKEIIQKMAGIDAAEDLTIDQLNALGGGDLLKNEAGYLSQIRNTKKSSARLKEAMAEDDLAVALSLLMAQQNYCIVFRERATQRSHLKLVGRLADQCQDTLVQLGTFLGSTMTADEYMEKLPSIQTMLLQYHIPTEVAFFLARPMFNHAINQKYDQLRKADPNYKKLSTSVKNQKYWEAVCEIMAPVHKSLVPLQPQRTWDDISPQFLATFWSLTMYDLVVPEDAYQSAISKAKAQHMAALEAAGGQSASAKARKEAERFNGVVEKLQDEKRKQADHVEKVMHRLKQEKDTWFPASANGKSSAKNEAVTRFLQLCLFPRCVATAADAVYCAKFVKTVHSLRTPGFSTLLCCDRLFCDVTRAVASLTEGEARRYGRFLCTMLEIVALWHKDPVLFNKECSGFPGFQTKYRLRDTPQGAATGEGIDDVGYENYRHVCHKWHYKLAKAMVTCLESRDYVQIRNALQVLIRILPYFPVLTKLAQFIERRVERVRDEEKDRRQDLYTLSASYLGQLRQRQVQGHMLKESDFHIPVEKEKAAKNHDSKTETATSQKHNGEVKEDNKTERKSSRQTTEDKSTPTTKNAEHTSKEKNSEERVRREESKERHSRKDDKKDDYDKEREREKRRERREEKSSSNKEERGDRRQEYNREERYIAMVGLKEDSRTYYEERGSSGAPAHYYRDMSQHSQEPLEHPDRDIKRRKVDGATTKGLSKHGSSGTAVSSEQERRGASSGSGNGTTPSLKPPKERRSATSSGDADEKEAKRKVGRKRHSAEDGTQQELKRRRDEDKVKLTSGSHQNGDLVESSGREKHHRIREPREITSPPYVRERSHERAESREKHRRSSENKRR